MATTNTVKIVFVDGEVLYLSGVVKYEYHADSQMFVIQKNNYNLLFTREQVKYVGRKFDLEEGANG